MEPHISTSDLGECSVARLGELTAQNALDLKVHDISLLCPN